MLPFGSSSQVVDNFSDGDFTTSPTWSGDAAEFIVNASFQLQLNNSIAADSYLSLPHNLANLNDKEWRFYVKQSFAGSASNYGRFYLSAASANFTANPDGYYIQMGEAGSTDAVRLMKSVGGSATQICAGADGQIVNSITFSIRVVRSAAGLWSLYIDTAAGQNFAFVASGTDVSLMGTFAGYSCVYTASNATKFYIDDVYIGNEILDISAPVLLSATATSINTFDMLFNEALNQGVAENLSNYDLIPFNSITSIMQDAVNPALMHATTSSNFSNGNTYTVTANNIEDLSGNDSVSQSKNFIYFVADVPVAGDVIINEFMCDPSPTVGLPELEFVEIYNKSAKFFDVTGWKLGDASGDGTISSGVLAPGEYLLLVATASVPQFANSTAVSSFPSLNNAGDDIVLKDNAGNIIDKITYTLEWYNDAIKDDGGYSLERINPNDPCQDASNWHASNDPIGGTPKALNSVNDITPDTQAPSISQIIAITPNFVTVEFNEVMDSLSLENASVTVTNPNLTELTRYVTSSQPSSFTIEFVENLQPSVFYTINIANAKDCWLNALNETLMFALPENPELGDLIINEILFDPLTGSSDYVELYNNSNKTLNLLNLQFANIANDTIANIKLVTGNVLLQAKDYVVFTPNIQAVINDYPAAVPANIKNIASLPTYANDKGSVIILFNDTVLDRVDYLDDWHFTLLDSKDGKALERLDFLVNSNSPDNWHTASEAVRFGTPGAQNSQYFPGQETADFSYTDDVISPDNDGYQDVLQINYRTTEPGSVITFTIYDEAGREIKKIEQSELAGNEGFFVWEGTNEEGFKASIGIYMGVMELFNVKSGTTIVKRKVFTVAGVL